MNKSSTSWTSWSSRVMKFLYTWIRFLLVVPSWLTDPCVIPLTSIRHLLHSWWRCVSDYELFFVKYDIECIQHDNNCGYTTVERRQLLEAWSSSIPNSVSCFLSMADWDFIVGWTCVSENSMSLFFVSCETFYGMHPPRISLLVITYLW